MGILLKNEDLSKYTTVRIGGIAKNMYIPQSVDELKNVIIEHPEALCIGGGSNLLIANREFDFIINLRDFDKSIQNMGDGRYRVGASVRLQTLIRQINKDGYGGIEYLFSVPGLVGGAVVMNAGSGIATGKSISDYIVNVNCLENGMMKSYSREMCEYSHRSSVFRKNPDRIITSVEFQFNHQDEEISKKRIEERIAFCKQTQDNSAPNFGSVYKHANFKIVDLIRKIQLGNKNGVHFSGKTANWLLNSGDKNGYKNAKKLINRVIWLHKVLGKKCEIEVVMWE